jgi:hypothetical protein
MGHTIRALSVRAPPVKDAMKIVPVAIVICSAYWLLVAGWIVIMGWGAE